MESLNEVNQIVDDYEHNSIQTDSWKIHENDKSILEESLYDVKEFIDDTHETVKCVVNNDASAQILYSYPWNLIADSGDVISYPNENLEHETIATVKNDYFDENIQSSMKSQSESRNIYNEIIEPHATSEECIPRNSQHTTLIEQELAAMTNTAKHDEHSRSTEVQSIEKANDEHDDIILPDKVDLDPYEPEQSSQLLLGNKSHTTTTIKCSHEDNRENDSSYTCHLSLFHIEYCNTSTCLISPQFNENQINASHSFQQLWSPQVDSTRLINSDTSKSTLSVFWSLIITGFYFIYSCSKILRYDTLLFGFCYWLGILFGVNAYFFIDFLLIVICIISLYVVTYEKWMFHSIYSNEIDNIDSEHQYWERVKLASYGLIIGTITTYVM